MITFQEKTRTFRVEGKTYSYLFCVNGYGHLEHLYFGEKLAGEDDLTPFVRRGYVSFAPNPVDGQGGYTFNNTLAEYSSFGRGDFRTPSLIVQDAQGATAGEFCYVSHTIEAGSPTLAGLPCARGGDTLTVRLEDAVRELVLELQYTAFDDCGVLVRSARLKNCAQSTAVIRRISSFCLDFGRDDFSLLRLYGEQANERMVECAPLPHGTQRIASARGASSHQFNPFFALLQRGAAEEWGAAYGFNLVYSGSYAAETDRTPRGLVRVTGGLGGLDFSWELTAGDAFQAPQALLAFSAEGAGGLSREFADFFREHLIDPKWVYAPRPVVINNWEATYFAFTEGKLFALIDRAAEAGIDTFVLDDGWFGERNSDRAGLGDWSVNRAKLPHGLKPIADRCKRHGMKFGLWFEPEAVNEDSALFRLHPEWVVGDPRRRPCKSRNEWLLDLSRREVVDYLFGAMCRILDENDITYVKWDMNRSLTDAYSRALPPHRQGEFAHRYILGVYRLCGLLKERYPHILFEGCSGGGGRFDAGMLYYFPQIWTSDNTDAWQRAKIQYGTSYAYPLSAMSCHVSAVPNHGTGRTISLQARGTVAGLGAFGYELDLTALGDGDLREIAAQIAQYKAIQPLVQKGDLYRLKDPFRDGSFAVALVAKDKREAYVVCLNGLDGRLRSEKLYINGLADGYRYRIGETGTVLSGMALRCHGLPPDMHGDFACAQWHLQAVE